MISLPPLTINQHLSVGLCSLSRSECTLRLCLLLKLRDRCYLQYHHCISLRCSFQPLLHRLRPPKASANGPLRPDPPSASAGPDSKSKEPHSKGGNDPTLSAGQVDNALKGGNAGDNLDPTPTSKQVGDFDPANQHENSQNIPPTRISPEGPNNSPAQLAKPYQYTFPDILQAAPFISTHTRLPAMSAQSNEVRTLSLG